MSQEDKPVIQNNQDNPGNPGRETTDTRSSFNSRILEKEGREVPLQFWRRFIEFLNKSLLPRIVEEEQLPEEKLFPDKLKTVDDWLGRFIKLESASWQMIDQLFDSTGQESDRRAVQEIISSGLLQLKTPKLPEFVAGIRSRIFSLYAAGHPSRKIGAEATQDAQPTKQEAMLLPAADERKIRAVNETARNIRAAEWLTSDELFTADHAEVQFFSAAEINRLSREQAQEIPLGYEEPPVIKLEVNLFRVLELCLPKENRELLTEIRGEFARLTKVKDCRVAFHWAVTADQAREFETNSLSAEDFFKKNQADFQRQLVEAAEVGIGSGGWTSSAWFGATLEPGLEVNLAASFFARLKLRGNKTGVYLSHSGPVMDEMAPATEEPFSTKDYANVIAVVLNLLGILEKDAQVSVDAHSMAAAAWLDILFYQQIFQRVSHLAVKVFHPAISGQNPFFDTNAWADVGAALMSSKEFNLTLLMPIIMQKTAGLIGDIRASLVGFPKLAKLADSIIRKIVAPLTQKAFLEGMTMTKLLAAHCDNFLKYSRQAVQAALACRNGVRVGIGSEDVAEIFQNSNFLLLMFTDQDDQMVLSNKVLANCWGHLPVIFRHLIGHDDHLGSHYSFKEITNLLSLITTNAVLENFTQPEMLAVMEAIRTNWDREGHQLTIGFDNALATALGNGEADPEKKKLAQQYLAWRSKLNDLVTSLNQNNAESDLISDDEKSWRSLLNDYCQSLGTSIIEVKEKNRQRGEVLSLRQFLGFNPNGFVEMFAKAQKLFFDENDPQKKRELLVKLEMAKRFAEVHTGRLAFNEQPSAEK